MIHDLTLRRLDGFLVPPPDGRPGCGDRLAGTMVAEAAALGFAFSSDLLAALRGLSSDDLADTWPPIRQALATAVGMHRRFEPLYPGFPRQVMALDEARLHLNALVHYLTDGRWRPVAPDEGRPGRRHRGAVGATRPPQTVGLVTPAEVDGLVARLAGSASALSPTDRDDIDRLISHYGDEAARLLPAAIPVRETVAVVGASLLHHCSRTVAAAFVAQRVVTATDALRLMAAWSGGDPSLATPTRFRSPPRSLRRLLLDRMEAAPDLVDDLARRPEQWKRLGERLHPGERAATHPRTTAAFAALRACVPPPTFAARVERGLAAGEPVAVLDLLGTRPGELARRLDVLLRRHPDPAAVIAAFERTAGDVSTPVLLQLDAQLDHLARAVPGEPLVRTFLPKGSTAKLWTSPDTRPRLDPGLARSVSSVARAALEARFARRPPLGRVYVDPALARFTVPLTQRSASRSFRTVGRGSRLPLPSTRYLRLFLWWTNGESRTDIDLSATLLHTSFAFVDVLSYYSLASWGGVHSGDIVDAPAGAAEFIDLDLDVLAERGVRYIVPSVQSYSGQPFCALPECFGGWMARSAPGSGEPFEPRTLIDRIDLMADTTICLPMIFDVVRREVIWSDLAVRRHPGRRNNVDGNLTALGLMVRAMTAYARPSLETLCSLHARARGTLVDGADEADTVFSAEPGFSAGLGVGRSGLGPFDVDRIRAELL